jgi:hypothetical protein
MHPVASLFRATKGTPEARLSTDKLTARKLHVTGCRGVIGLQAVNPASSSKSSNRGFFPTFDRLPGNHG